MAEPREAKRKRTRQPRMAMVEIPDATDNADEIEGKSEDAKAAEEQIDSAIESSGLQPEAIIYRVNEGTGKEAYLDKVTPELVNQEWLAKEYGGGRYRVQFRKPDPSGKNRLVYDKQIRFEIDPNLPAKPPRHARPAASGPISNSDGSPAAPSSMDAVLSSGILSLFTQQAENARVQADFFRTVMAEGSRKGPGMIEMITAITPLIAPLLTMLTRQREEKDPIELAAKLLEIRQATTPAGAPPTDPIKMFKDLLELREMMGGEGGVPGADPNAPLLKLVETIAPQFIQMFSRAQEIDAQAKLAAGRGPTATPTPARATVATPGSGAHQRSGPVSESSPEPHTVVTGHGATSQPPEGQPEMWKLLVSARVPVIMKLAERGKRADLYAELEADNIPDMFKDAVREFVEREDFVELIFAEYPQLNAHKEWMLDFFDVFAAALTGELDADDDEFEEVDVTVEGEVKPVAEVPATTDTPPVQNNGNVE